MEHTILNTYNLISSTLEGLTVDEKVARTIEYYCAIEYQLSDDEKIDEALKLKEAINTEL